jgi:hypothetical protein
MDVAAANLRCAMLPTLSRSMGTLSIPFINVELLVFEHERPIPVDHPKYSSTWLRWQFSHEFAGKSTLAFQGQLGQKILLVLEVLVEQGWYSPVVGPLPSW